MSNTERLVDDYLHRLERALRPLPADQRQEILAEVGEHIRAARAEGGKGSGEGSVAIILGRLGTPEAIALSAIPRPREWHLSYGLIEVSALFLGILAAVGAFLSLRDWRVGIPSAILWLGEVVLVWRSKNWRLRDKLIGILVPLAALIFTIAFDALFGPVMVFGYLLFRVFETAGFTLPVIYLGVRCDCAALLEPSKRELHDIGRASTLSSA